MKKRKGLGIVEILIFIVALTLLSAVGWLAISNMNKPPTVSPNSATLRPTAGNPLIENRGNVSILRAVAASEDLKAFLAEEFKDDCVSHAPRNPQISVVSTDEKTALLRRGCIDPSTFVFAQKTDGQWRLLEDTYYQFLGGIPYCEIVDRYDISTEIASNCLEKSKQPQQYIVRGEVITIPEQEES